MNEQPIYYVTKKNEYLDPLPLVSKRIIYFAGVVTNLPP